MNKFEKKVNDIINITLDSINMLKNTNQQEQNVFIPIGILLLKWINDSKYRSHSINYFSYNDLMDIYVSKNINKYLYNVCKVIETNNYELKDVFTKLCFDNIEYIDSYCLNDIVWSYSKIDLSDEDCETNITGPVMDFFLQYLSENFSLYSFITTPAIKKILSELFKLNEYMYIGDIACGTGGILSEIKTLIDKNYKNTKFITLYGQEINYKIALIAKINLLLHGVYKPKIEITDTLREPVLSRDMNKKFDIILSNLPLGLKFNVNQVGNKDEFKYGWKTKNNSEWLFIQRGIEALNSSGKAAFIVSKSTLTRKSEIKIREYILYDDIVEAIISLPNNLYGTKTIPIEILVINKSKIHKNKILFVDASRDYIKKERGRNDLSIENIKKIIKTYHKFEQIEGYSKLVDLCEIKNNRFELDSTYYINNQVDSFKNLKMKKLCEVAEIKRGLQVSKSRISNSEIDSHYYIKISDLNNNTIEFNEKINTLSQRELTSFELRTNDILISARGVLIKTAIYEKDMPPSVFSGNILLIRLNKNYNPYFLKFYFDSKEGQKSLFTIQEGATIKALNPNKLKNISIPDINIEHQNKLAKKIICNENVYKKRICYAQEKYNEEINSINKEIYQYISIY